MRTDVNGINVARLMELFAVDDTEEEPGSTSSKVLAINIVSSISFYVQFYIATDSIYFLNERNIKISKSD